MELATSIGVNRFLLAGRPGSGLGITTQTSQAFRQDREAWRRVCIAALSPFARNACVLRAMPAPQRPFFTLCHGRLSCGDLDEPCHRPTYRPTPAGHGHTRLGLVSRLRHPYSSWEFVASVVVGRGGQWRAAVLPWRCECARTW